MKPLTEKIIDEGKLIGRTFVPFNCFNDKYDADTKKNNKFPFYNLTNILLTVGEVALLGFTLRYATPNFTKWSEIQKQEDQQKIYQQNQEINSSFYNTAGKDSLMDYKEFEQFYKENFYDK